MAKVENNIVTLGLRGKIGNLVFRKRGNKTTAYILTPRTSPASRKQKEAQAKFGEAVRKAISALQDADTRNRFVKLAKKEGRESPYSAAISYFLRNS